MKFWISNLQANFSDWWLRYFLWNCPLVNVTTDDKSILIQGKGLLPSGQCLPSSMLPVEASVDHNELKKKINTLSKAPLLATRVTCPVIFDHTLYGTIMTDTWLISINFSDFVTTNKMVWIIFWSWLFSYLWNALFFFPGKIQLCLSRYCKRVQQIWHRSDQVDQTFWWCKRDHKATI